MNPLAIETASSRFNPRQGIDVGVDGCESICRLEIRQIELLPAPWQANSSCSRQRSTGKMDTETEDNYCSIPKEANYLPATPYRVEHQYNYFEE